VSLQIEGTGSFPIDDVSEETKMKLRRQGGERGRVLPEQL
jgi:hypothetical protein